MKAERRHQLQRNALDRALERAPEFGRKYGGKLLLAVIVIALVIVVIRQRSLSARNRAIGAQEGLAQTRSIIANLAGSELWQLESGAAAAERDRMIVVANEALRRAARDSSNPRLQAEALLAQADLYWQLANLPELPGAATRPALKLKEDPADLLERAKSSYQKVLQQYPDQPMAVVAARFGLANVAENQRDWETARKMYEAIKDEPAALKAFKDQAMLRLSYLPQIQQPVLIGAASRPTALPAATTAATTQP